jgi:uncharacterized membrane protein
MAGDESRDVARLESLSDGVFAVVITLLALDLKPESTESARDAWALLALLAARWPVYVAYLTSFATVLIMWVNHHGMFRFVEHVDMKLLFANGFLLMMITLVPFTTTLLADHLTRASGTAAGALYAGLFAIINVGYNLTWEAVRREARRALSTVPPAAVRRITRNYRLGFPAYLLAAVVARWSPVTTTSICAMLLLLWAVHMQPVHASRRS